MAVPTLGLDLGGTKCLGLAVAPDGEVLAERREETPVGAGAEAVLDVLVAVASDLAAAVPDAGAVGLGAPGLVDRDGVLHFAPNLPGVVGVPLRAELERRLRRAAVVDNDVTCAAWAEYELGAAQGHEHVVVVALGTGIGGGLVSEGRLLRGAHGFAGEIGHMVIDPDGPPCTCGQRGCWEQFAAGPALGRLARDAAAAGRVPRVVELAGGDVDAVQGEHVGAAAAEGDPGARAVLDGFARWVALGLANLTGLLDPSRFVVGGGLVDLGPLLLDPVQRWLGELVEGKEDRSFVPEVVPAALGEHAGAIGAARLAALA